MLDLQNNVTYAAVIKVTLESIFCDFFHRDREPYETLGPSRRQSEEKPPVQINLQRSEKDKLVGDQ